MDARETQKTREVLQPDIIRGTMSPRASCGKPFAQRRQKRRQSRKLQANMVRHESELTKPRNEPKADRGRLARTEKGQDEQRKRTSKEEKDQHPPRKRAQEAAMSITSLDQIINDNEIRGGGPKQEGAADGRYYQYWNFSRQLSGSRRDRQTDTKCLVTDSLRGRYS